MGQPQTCRKAAEGCETGETRPPHCLSRASAPRTRNLPGDEIDVTVILPAPTVNIHFMRRLRRLLGWRGHFGNGAVRVHFGARYHLTPREASHKELEWYLGAWGRRE